MSLPINNYQDDYKLDISEEEVWICEVHASGHFHEEETGGYYTATFLDVVHAVNTNKDGEEIVADEEKLNELAGMISVTEFLEQ